MKKHYRVPKINNLQELHWEQKRVRHAYKKLELNWINSFLSPDAITNFLIQSLITSPAKGNSKEKKKGKALKKDRKPNRTTTLRNSEPFVEKITEPTKSGKKNYKKLAKSFLIWQLGSMIAFIGLNIAKHRRKKRKIALAKR